LALRKLQNTGNLKRKYYIAISGEIALEETKDLRQDRPEDE